VRFVTATSSLAARRYRKSVTALTAAEVTSLRDGFVKMQALHDDRGYEYWAGIHGLPLPMWCQHGTLLFLPWHRAYLYHFEQYLLDAGSTVSLPWWDWSTQAGIPAAYADGELASGPVSGIPAAQFTEKNIPPVSRTSRTPGPDGAGHGPAGLPGAAEVTAVLALKDFEDFSMQLEDLHNRVHMWVGGTMSEIPVAAHDPLFWSHHAMIDRLWSLWQLAHPGAGTGSVPLDTPLAPFPAMTVRQTLSVTPLGYQYAAATSSATPGA
jgi:tyrosinase